MNKKAIFFTIDALIALIVILFAVLVIYPSIRPRLYESELSGDIIKVLSSLKIGEIQGNSVVVQLKSDGRINDYNKTILEQVGEFYITDITIARELAGSVLSTIDERENIGIWYGDELIASRNSTSLEKASNIEVDKQIISGIQVGSTLTGVSAMAYLTSSSQKKYFYFGGYIGDGNISVNISYSGNLTGINLEVAANTNFSFCVNDGCCGAGIFVPYASQLEPKSFSLWEGYQNCFSPGSNIVKFYGRGGESLYFAGGFIKITYNQSAVYFPPNKYYFPGVDGIINVYDGFYVPGTLTNLEVHLKAKVDDPGKNMYMKIGDKEIFKANTGGALVNLDYNKTNSAAINDILNNYLQYSKKTIPVRIAVEGIDYIQTEIDTEVISVAGLSGNVNSLVGDINGDGDTTDVGETKVPVLQEANRILVNSLLKLTNTLVGLSPVHELLVKPEMSHYLSNNNESLIAKINNWESTSTLNLCNGLKNATDSFTAGSDLKFIVLFAYKDNMNSCFTATGDASTAEMENYICNGAPDNDGKIFPKDNIIIFTIGMGLDESKDMYDALNKISQCTDGQYVDADSSGVGGMADLIAAYNKIIEEIKAIIYSMQTIDVEASADAKSSLSTDSYIKFDYTGAGLPVTGAALITTNEKLFDNEDTGSFSFSSPYNILETKIISYSGPYWTQYIFINNSVKTIFYNLSSYGSNYTGLGDPYAVNIPNLLVKNDINNKIDLTTGVSPLASYSGSSYNKIIYTLFKEMPSYSNIASFSEGCRWNIEFSSGLPINDLKIPETAIDTCYYNSTARTCEVSGTQQPCESSDDAVKIAVYELLKSLDDNLDGRVDVDFAQQDLQIDYSDITGIPYPYTTEVQVRKWD